jgi:F0F1-type ATP synthase delta subunit
MTAISRHRELSKKLVRLSLDDDSRVDEEKVLEVLDSLRSLPTSDQKLLLRFYLDQIKKEMEKSVAILEYAGKPSDEAIEALKQKLSLQYGRSIVVEMRKNQDLLAGIRVSVGDDVYEDSAATRLRPLIRALT